MSNSYPFLSTNFAGTLCVPDAARTPTEEECVDAYALIDVTAGFRVPGTGATLQVGVSNLLNTAYRSFVGVPAVGRLAIARVDYDFF